MEAPMTLWVRDNPITTAQNKADDVKNTFSSWDNCMKKDYCKWPAIILIVIVSLIVASIVFCLVRCLCCGLECCCGCFSCLNSCCSCCRPRRSRWGGGDRYRDEPPGFGHGGGNYGGYQPTPAAPVYVNVQAPPPASRYEPSRQYASFDQPSKRSVASDPYSAHDDSLPPMPSWKEAQSKRVEMEEEEVEMDHLNYSHQPMLNDHGAPARSIPTPSQQVPGQGLYSDSPAHHATGDLGDGYGEHHDPSAAYAGAAGVVGGAAVAGGAAHAYDQYHDQGHYQQQHEQHYDQYSSQAPQHQGYTSPVQQTGVTGFASPPPPSYHTGGPISPVGTPGPAYQAYGGSQQSGVSGGNQYTAYQPHNQPAHGTWHDV